LGFGCGRRDFCQIPPFSYTHRLPLGVLSCRRIVCAYKSARERVRKWCVDGVMWGGGCRRSTQARRSFRRCRSGSAICSRRKRGCFRYSGARRESRPARGGRRRSVAGALTSVSCNDTHFWYSPAERLGMVRVASQLIVAVGKLEESVGEEDACGRPGYRLPHPHPS
jgi:hypothetical protein